jgi:GT2 family glycosyltransferase
MQQPIHVPMVSVVVLSYNRPHLLRESLASLAAQTYPLSALEILVVDNRSAASEQVRRVVQTYPGVGLIANESNLGFTGGMNVGLRAVRGEYVYLTEDDIVHAPDYLEQLMAYLARDPKAGLVSGVMYNRDDGCIRCAGGNIRLTAVFKLTINGEGQLDPGKAENPIRVSYIPGATMLARAEVWKKLNGFREDFFMYHEDVEICLRLARLGLSLVVVPAAKSYHFPPLSGSCPNDLQFHKLKNFVAIYLLHAAGRVLPEFLLRHCLLALARAAWRAPAQVPTLLRAWGYIGMHCPRLLRDRRRLGQKVASSAPQ